MSDRQRVAIVTGAAGGIGRALVGGLLGAGLRVAAVDRTADAFGPLAASVGDSPNLLMIAADPAQDAAAADIVKEGREPIWQIDILGNHGADGQATLPV